jgi:hypothetical protein
MVGSRSVGLTERYTLKRVVNDYAGSSSAKNLAHLRGELTESELVRWAEDAFVTFSESDQDVPNEQTIMDVLAYTGAGDTLGFPLTWSVLADFLDRLGMEVEVVARTKS